MPTPKSVVKIKKGNVEYVSNIDAANYYLFELSRAALRDIGKFLVKSFKDEYYSHFKKITGRGGKATRYKVYSNKSTKYPRLEIGLPHASRGNNVEGFYAYFQEFGSVNVEKLGILSNVAESNVAEIVKIESQYLSGLEDEAKALQMIDSEGEYEGGAE